MISIIKSQIIKFIIKSQNEAQSSRYNITAVDIS